MKKENNVSASKKLTILALVLFLIFVCINIFWIFTMYLPYCGYSYAIADENTIGYTQFEISNKIGKYGYTISKTPYLGYDDFLRVAVETSGATKGIAIFGIYIYPNIWGDYEYYVSCNEGNATFMFEINEQGEFIPFDENDTEFNEKAQQILKDHKTEIMGFMKAAKDTWGLEAKHDVLMGIKAKFHDSYVGSFVELFLIFSTFILIISLFIWKLKVKIPFRKLNCELDVSYGSKEMNYKRVVENYEFFASNPRLFKSNGFLAVQKLPYEEERLTLVIFPDKKKEKTKYYALLAGPKTVIRKAEKVEFEYACGKALSSNQFIIDHNEELADLAVQANLFWPI